MDNFGKTLKNNNGVRKSEFGEKKTDCLPIFSFFAKGKQPVLDLKDNFDKLFNNHFIRDRFAAGSYGVKINSWCKCRSINAQIV